MKTPRSRDEWNANRILKKCTERKKQNGEGAAGSKQNSAHSRNRIVAKASA
jgi:hypothetical protein